MWTAKAAQMGFRWKIGNGEKVKFWEDNWLGNSSLSIQYWDIYILVNEKTQSVFNLWDGTNLKCTFRRCVDDRLMNPWLEVVQLASTISFSDDGNLLLMVFILLNLYIELLILEELYASACICCLGAEGPF
jgi:hypothetical protein